MRRRLVALLLFVFVAGCPASSTTNTTGDGGVSDPVQACLDTLAALADASKRCGQDYQAVYSALVVQIAGGDCSKITGVRDEAALRQGCLPSLKTISCPDLQGRSLDATCQEQLQRPAAFVPVLVPASPAAP